MTQLWRSALVAGIAISLGACAHGGVCAGARRIDLSRDDTKETKAQVTASNEYYEKQGCFTTREREGNLFGGAAAAIGLK